MSYFIPFDINYNIDLNKFDPNEIVIQRKLNDVKDIFSDQKAVKEILNSNNPTIIDVYMAPVPETVEHIMALMTIIHPGKIGGEYYMTKGHIHDSDEAPEVYITMKGEGKLILQTEDNQTFIGEMKPGTINYIPSNWAHRAVNIGNEDLVFFGIYPASSKRDYSFIGQNKKNFIKMVVERNGEVLIIDNPHSK
jgi:glucose-6-phosphate isomerase